MPRTPEKGRDWGKFGVLDLRVRFWTGSGHPHPDQNPGSAHASIPSTWLLQNILLMVVSPGQFVAATSPLEHSPAENGQQLELNVNETPVQRRDSVTSNNTVISVFFRYRSHRMRRCSQLLQEKYGTHNCQHCKQHQRICVHTHLHANLLTRPVWTRPWVFFFMHLKGACQGQGLAAMLKGWVPSTAAINAWNMAVQWAKRVPEIKLQFLYPASFEIYIPTNRPNSNERPKMLSISKMHNDLKNLKCCKIRRNQSSGKENSN